MQCAPKASTRYESDDYFAKRYRRIKARRGHKRAVVAVARMMLACIYRTLSNGVKFDPTDREVEGDARDGHAARDCAARAIELLAALGYDISSLKTPA